MTTDAALLDTLSRLQPLAGLGRTSLRSLVPLCNHERVPRHLNPFALKDWRDQVAYLVKGELKIDQPDGSSMLYIGGTGDALYPLVSGGRTPRSSKAITDVELLRFNEDALDIFVTWDQLAIPAETAGAEGDDTDWHTRSGVFAAQNFVDGAFAGLPAAHIDALLRRFERVPVRRGEAVVRQGEPGDYYYVIDQGRGVVTRDIGGVTVEVAQLKSGDAFGEEALVADGERNATVTMKTDGLLLRLGKADFVALLREPLLKRVSPAEAAAKVAAGAVYVDPRFPVEYRVDGLPGAINVPLNELRGAMAMLDPAKEYIVYCQSGRRSSAAAFLLSQKGYRASLLDGGLKALAAEKGTA
ncbi:MAG TPA: cyclic nucleotide-binding domain-containing protein [Rhodocyclaceae bacterium]